jgi:hypothetical protein
MTSTGLLDSSHTYASSPMMSTDPQDSWSTRTILIPMTDRQDMRNIQQIPMLTHTTPMHKVYTMTILQLTSSCQDKWHTRKTRPKTNRYQLHRCGMSPIQTSSTVQLDN